MNYREILRDADRRTLVLASLSGYLALAIPPLAIVVAARNAFGDFAAAGTVAAGFALGTSILGPYRGWHVDRHGIQRGLLPLVGAYAALLVLLAVLIPHLGVVSASMMAAIGGATTPPLMATIRTVWSRLAGNDGWVQQAYAFETALQEISFVVGPLLSAAWIAAVSATAALAFASVLLLAGGVGLLTFSRTFTPEAAVPVVLDWGRRTAVGYRGTWILAAISLPLGVIYGVLEVSLPAFTEAHGSIAAAGALFSALSLGSIMGALWYGARGWRISLVTRLLFLLCLLTALLVPLSLLDNAYAMAVPLLLAGTTLAPITVVLYTLLDWVAPREVATEAFTWITATELGGVALGGIGAGWLVDRKGVDVALMAAPIGASAALAAVFLVRRILARYEPDGGTSDLSTERLASSAGAK